MSGHGRTRGVLCALGADAAFIGIGGLIAATPALDAVSIGSLRILGAMPLLAAILVARAPDEARALRRLGWRGWGRGAATAALLGANIWLFAAAPLWGEADGLAQGYLLLPVCLVAFDLLRGARLGGPALCGVLLAGCGIAHSLLATGRVSRVALFVGISMTLYFDLHKRRHLSLLQRVVVDFALIAPFCVVALACRPAAAAQAAAIMRHAPAAIALGAATALAYLFYLGASKALNHAVFGILTLIEPIGLAVIAYVCYRKPVSPWDLGMMAAGAALVSMPRRAPPPIIRRCGRAAV